MNGLRVEAVDPRWDPRWRTLSEAAGSLFTAPPWIAAVTQCYGFTPVARVAFDASGAPVAGLAWIDVDDLRGGRRIALPFGDRADPILIGPAAQRATGWAAVAADALDGTLPFTLRCLDESAAAGDARLAAVGEAAWHATPLDAPPDELHARFRSQTRRNIATAQRAGVEVVLSADSDAVAAYHRLHVGLRKHKYRLLAQPRAFFDRIWKEFHPHDGVRVGLAMVDGVPVAGAMYLVWGKVVYYKFGASTPEHLALRPNDALHWALIRWAVDRGLTALDWGLSDLDQPGLVHYKRKWATVERRIQTLNAGGPALRRNPQTEETLGALTRLLTGPDVPHDVTDAAGALLYRYFC